MNNLDSMADVILEKIKEDKFIECRVKKIITETIETYNNDTAGKATEMTPLEIAEDNLKKTKQDILDNVYTLSCILNLFADDCDFTSGDTCSIISWQIVDNNDGNYYVFISDDGCASLDNHSYKLWIDNSHNLRAIGLGREISTNGFGKFMNNLQKDGAKIILDKGSNASDYIIKRNSPNKSSIVIDTLL